MMSARMTHPGSGRLRKESNDDGDRCLVDEPPRGGSLQPKGSVSMRFNNREPSTSDTSEPRSTKVTGVPDSHQPRSVATFSHRRSSSRNVNRTVAQRAGALPYRSTATSSAHASTE